MANLSINSGSKTIDTGNIKVRELKDNITLEQAIEATQNNGIDEAFVEADGKRYVIFSDDNLKLDSKASIQIDGKAARMIQINNEINSFGEGISYVPQKSFDLAKAAVKPLKHIVPNASTGLAIIVGVGAGAITRNAFTPGVAKNLFSQYGDLSSTGMAVATTAGLGAAAAGAKFGSRIGGSMSDDSTQGKILGGLAAASLTGLGAAAGTRALAAIPSKSGGIGLAAGAIIGVASVTAAADQSSRSNGAKQAKAWATGVGSVAAGMAMPEIVKLVSKIQIPELAIKGGKIAATAAIVGGVMATAGLAVAGATKSAKEDSFDAITK